jgi:hypothetical protein
MFGSAGAGGGPRRGGLTIEPSSQATNQGTEKKVRLRSPSMESIRPVKSLHQKRGNWTATDVYKNKTRTSERVPY